MGRVANLTATTTATSSVTLAWDDLEDPDVTKFQLRLMLPAPPGTWSDICVTATAPACPSKTSHTVRNLQGGKGYTYQVRAVATSSVGATSSVTVYVPHPGTDRPAAPTNLAATPGDRSVTLSWDDPNNIGISGYQYRYSIPGEDTTWQTMAGSNATTTSYLVTNLANGIAHTFQVRAAIQSGHSHASSKVTTKPNSRPAAPIGLTATAGNAQAVLEWLPTTAANVDSWQYQQKFSASSTWGGWQDMTGSNATSTSYVVILLNNNSAYTFRIRAKNNAFAGATSTEATTTPSTGAVPARPSGFAAAAGDTQVRLSWTGPTDANITGWQLRRRDGNGTFGNWATISAGADYRAHTVTTLTNGTTYGFQLRAVNANGGGPPATGSATPLAVPAKPANLTATNNYYGAGMRTIRLQWTQSTDKTITGYQYHMKDGANPYGGWITMPGGNRFTDGLTILNLADNTTYTFRIRAVNASGPGPPVRRGVRHHAHAAGERAQTAYRPFGESGAAGR